MIVEMAISWISGPFSDRCDWHSPWSSVGCDMLNPRVTKQTKPALKLLGETLFLCNWYKFLLHIQNKIYSYIMLIHVISMRIRWLFNPTCELCLSGKSHVTHAKNMKWRESPKLLLSADLIRLPRIHNVTSGRFWIMNQAKVKETFLGG